jgi:N-methylhydantoinase B
MVLAGGTDVYPAKAARAGWGDMRHADILDISAVPGLRGITEEAGAWRIGALTTWSDVIRAELPAQFDGLKLAAREVGGVQIQNRGTLAGNICTASPAGDGAPNLLALDASIELTSRRGRRIVPMADFIDGYRHALPPDEIVTASSCQAGSDAHPLPQARRAQVPVISIVMVAGGSSRSADRMRARLAIGSCSAVPQRLHALEAALIAQPSLTAADVAVASHLEGLSPIDDIRGSAAYRREAALALTRDLLRELAGDERRRAA